MVQAAFQTGDTRERGGWVYERQGDGRWLPVRPAAGGTAAPAVTPITGPDRRAQAAEERAQAAEDRAQRAEERAAANAAREATNAERRSTGGANFDDENSLRSQFNGLPAVRTYEQVLPAYVGAMTANDTRAGDMNLVYGAANIMDPGAVVRESDALMVQRTGALDEQLLGHIRTLNGGGQLTPEIRRGIRAELQTRGRVIGSNYNQARRRYGDLARRYNFDPDAIVGPHPAGPIRAQLGLDAPEELRFLDELPPEVDNPLSPEQQAAYDGFVQANPRFTAEQLQQFGSSIGATIHNAEDIVRARDTGAGTRPATEARRPPPDISDARGSGGALETVDAGVRGVADVASFGFADELSALGDTVTRGGTYEENLDRQRAIDEYDFEHHTAAAIGGRLGGALLIPTGVTRAAQGAAVRVIESGGSVAEARAAARGAAALRMGLEGGGVGAGYGFGSGEGDILDRAANAAVDTVIGAGAGGALGRVGLGVPRIREPSALPPLVDPVTGRLNQPLQSALPAERMEAASAFGINLPMGSAGDRTAALLEKGLDILPGSAGVMEEGRTVLRGEVDRAVEDLGGQFGAARTMDEAGGAAQRGAKNWIDRFERVVGRAYDRIPIAGTAEAALTNTRQALGEMLDVFRSNPRMRQLFQNGRLRTYLDALEAPPSAADEVGDADPIAGVLRTVGRSIEGETGRLSWEDLKHFRSIIGEEIGEVRFSESPARSQLRRLYGALSEDMRATASARGSRALRAFERANTLYKEGQDRIEGALVRLLGDDARNNPEAAAAAIQTIARGGRGSSNINQLREIRNSLRKGDEWNEVAASLIRLMGQPAQSQGREFNPQTFIDNYSGMTEEARTLLFGGTARGEKSRAALRSELDSFVTVIQRLAATNALRNTSNTAPGITAAGTVGGIIGTFLDPLAGVGVFGQMAGSYGGARLWTNPGFVRRLTGYAQALERGADEATVEAQRTRLTRFVRTALGVGTDVSPLGESLLGEGFDEGRGPAEGSYRTEP